MQHQLRYDLISDPRGVRCVRLNLLMPADQAKFLGQDARGMGCGFNGTPQQSWS